MHARATKPHPVPLHARITVPVVRGSRGSAVRTRTTGSFRRLGYITWHGAPSTTLTRTSKHSRMPARTASQITVASAFVTRISAALEAVKEQMQDEMTQTSDLALTQGDKKKIRDAVRAVGALVPSNRGGGASRRRRSEGDAAGDQEDGQEHEQEQEPAQAPSEEVERLRREKVRLQERLAEAMAKSINDKKALEEAEKALGNTRKLLGMKMLTGADCQGGSGYNTRGTAQRRCTRSSRGALMNDNGLSAETLRLGVIDMEAELEAFRKELEARQELYQRKAEAERITYNDAGALGEAENRRSKRQRVR